MTKALINKDIFQYKCRFISFILIFSYAFMHVKLTGVYDGATLEDMSRFVAPLPFGQRLLIPTMVHWVHKILPFNIEEIFFIFEVLFSFLSLQALQRLFSLQWSSQFSLLFSWLFFLLLPLVSIVNYRLSIEGEAPLFFPADTASLFFTAIGFYLCLKKNWLAFFAVIFIATFNRESSLLLVLLIPALYWREARKTASPLLIAAFVYFLARLIVIYLTRDLTGPYLEWFFHKTFYTHFYVNMFWLLQQNNILFFSYTFSGLVLFWFCFYDYIPGLFTGIRYLVLFHFLVLLLVGNLMESRVFTEMTVFLYYPLSLGIRNWVENHPQTTNKNIYLSYIDRYLILLILVVIALFWPRINHLIVIGIRYIIQCC